MSIFSVGVRGFTYFNVFPQFSYITKMTLGMITNSLSIALMIIYFALVFSVMMEKSNSEAIYKDCLEINYNLIFGNLPDFSDKNYFQLILIVFGSAILPIFLINFLIAKLSGTYSTLENRQKSLIYKEIAETLMELEAIIRFLRLVFKIKVNLVPSYAFFAIDQKTLDSENEGLELENQLNHLKRRSDKNAVSTVNSFKKKLSSHNEQVMAGLKDLKGYLRKNECETSIFAPDIRQELIELRTSSESRLDRLELAIENMSKKLDRMNK
jgi:hypothetical protein